MCALQRHISIYFSFVDFREATLLERNCLRGREGVQSEVERQREEKERGERGRKKESKALINISSWSVVLIAEAH